MPPWGSTSGPQTAMRPSEVIAAEKEMPESMSLQLRRLSMLRHAVSPQAMTFCPCVGRPATQARASPVAIAIRCMEGIAYEDRGSAGPHALPFGETD